MNRSPNTEAAFLNAAGNCEFTVATMARLHEGQHAYGNRWSERTLHELLSEVAEEAIDVAAWSALTAQHDDLKALSDADENRVVACLDELAYLASKAWTVTATAQRIAERHATPDTTPVAA